MGDNLEEFNMDEPLGVNEAKAAAAFWEEWKEKNPNRLSRYDDDIIDKNATEEGDYSEAAMMSVDMLIAGRKVHGGPVWATPEFRKFVRSQSRLENCRNVANVIETEEPQRDYGNVFYQFLQMSRAEESSRLDEVSGFT